MSTYHMLLVLFAVLSTTPILSINQDEWAVAVDIVGLPHMYSRGSHFTSCYDAVLSLASMHCHTFTRHTKVSPDVDVTICLHKHLPEGTVRMQHMPIGLGELRTPLQSNSSGSLSIFKLRVLGPDGLYSPQLTYCGPQTAYAKLRFETLGEHIMEVLLLHTNYSYSDIKNNIPEPHPWAQRISMMLTDPGTLILEHMHGKRKYDNTSVTNFTNTIDATYASNATQIIKVGMHLSKKASYSYNEPLCSQGGLLPGHWHFRQFPCPTSKVFEDGTCVKEGVTSKRCSNTKYNILRNVTNSSTSDIYFQPTDCKLMRVEAINRSSCMETLGKVCLMGDSHMRILILSLAYVFNLKKNGEDNGLPPYDKIKIVRALYGDASNKIFGDPTANISACDTILFNFGAWPASFQTRAHPWSLLKYHNVLLKYAKSMLDPYNKSKNVWWVMTTAMGLKTTPGDWRTDPLILAYNKISMAIMHVLKIPIIDLWSITLNLLESSTDGSHYPHETIGGLAIQQAVVHALCYNHVLPGREN